VRGVNDADNILGWKRRLFTHVSDFQWARQHQVLKDFRTVADVVAPSAEPGPLHFVPQAEPGVIQQKLPDLPAPGSLVVIHPTSRWAYKQWLPQRWAAVADGLTERYGLRVVFSCGPAGREREAVAAIQATARMRHASTAGALSLHELGVLLGQARLFLGVDTVAMHLAAAMQTPTVALFGPSSEWSWHPWQCRHELVLGECSCKLTRRFVCDKSRPFPCMERIGVDAVLGAAGRLLDGA
jgi:heptosyltransferase-3